MNWALEVLTLAVGDVDKSLKFYTDQVGFTLDVDWQANERYRVVQLTPPGSACSIQFGIGLTDATPGASRTTYLAVTDLAAAHRELTARGVPVGDLRHKANLPDWQGDWAPGLEPDRLDYASIFDFADPDGNTWVVQEIGYRG
ncbi:VOC family protein [Amycolatopsis rhabdoformis]|uniref:VOC family protein n=1 Tax=Amycolatopsis rhabdoformis TaxID=1448059 RepID=A0ABZ1HVN2_9PSEU|nr:VOC family protein [Amycolatopsis rhabdoformis]WSE26325.1 VOC family protein [Amycolatopsis rhabdoformis]